MPYVKQEDRDRVLLTVPETPGELNYAVSQIVEEYVAHKLLNYQTINDVVGALEGAKIEFYRRLAVPYEEVKIKENGDLNVYEKFSRIYIDALKPKRKRGHDRKVRSQRTKRAREARTN